MYLRKLELHGFKSFAQKTTITFAPGVTAIVGPNGCGKSNVIDAVRWVLGEQRARALRSERMDNVIFNGAAAKRPLGMADVSLTIHNAHGVLPTHYEEVTVARRLYRSGESEYLLNGTACRLKDVLDLFMDTGLGPGAYSVIELPMVEDILSENAAERRRLFEEAAGVTRYKLRRRQALQKLDSTHVDLTRIEDLSDELERRVNALARQAQKADRYRKLAGRLGGLELALAAHDHARIEGDARAAESELGGLRDEAGALAARLGAAEAHIERERTVLLDQESAAAAARQALAGHVESLRSIEAEASVAAERRAADTRALERLAHEAAADGARATELAAEAEALVARAGVADAAVAEAEAAEVSLRTAGEVAAAAAETARAGAAAARLDADRAGTALAEARAAVERLADRRALRTQEQARLTDEAAALAGRLADEAASTSEATEFATAEAGLARAEAALDEVRRLDEARRSEAGAAATAVSEARLARDTARAEADLVAAVLAAPADDGASAFLASSPSWGRPLQTVADVVGCDERDRAALDAALGEWAGRFVVDTEQDAEDALAQLHAADAGRATFLALNRIPVRVGAERSPTPRGTVPVLTLARAATPRHESLLRLLFTNVFVAPSLAEARALRAEFPAARFVTSAGEWTSAMGVTHGGSARVPTPASRLGLVERRDRTERALEGAQAVLLSAEARNTVARIAAESAAAALASAESEARSARGRRDDAQALAASRAATRTALEDARRRAEARAAELAGTIDDADPEELSATARARDAAFAAAAQARDDAEAAADNAYGARRAADAAHAEGRLALAAARAAAEAVARERERVVRMTDDLARREAERAQESERLRASLGGADLAEAERGARLEGARAGAAPLREALDAAEAAHLDARAAVSAAEEGLRELRRARDAAVERQTGAEVRLAEARARLDALEERLQEDHGVTLSDAAARLDELTVAGEFEVEKARTELPRLREAVRSLGAVNALALEEFDEEKTRLDSLRTQRDDLREAEATLRDTISEINRTAAERFGETFEQVREAFQGLFRDLFGETAQADLALEGDDPLEAPIEIFAQPRGKRPSTISQLSGGEKALTAIALLFAIYLVKPSPFCILDEVDAPLDDTNVERFMRLIRQFEDRTQFILVTHNKLTMEAADRLYGITMPEPGVSRLVGVRFDGGDVEEAVAEEVA